MSDLEHCPVCQVEWQYHSDIPCHLCESELTPDGNGAFCKHCGATLG